MQIDILIKRDGMGIKIYIKYYNEYFTCLKFFIYVFLHINILCYMHFCIFKFLQKNA